jgi:hypothetical protein
MDPSTPVYVVRCTLAPAAVSCLASRGPTAGSVYPVTEALGWDDWMPGPFPGWGRRWNRQTGGEILSAHI